MLAPAFSWKENDLSRLGIVLCLIPVTVVVVVVFALSWKQTHHEFLHLPGIVACQRGEAMNLEVTPNRVHGRMETFDFANCTFYWWENNRGGD